MNSPPPDDPEAVAPTDVLRVVVDANIALAMFLVRRDQPMMVSAKRKLLDLLPSAQFRWLWSADILADYRRGAQAIADNARLQRKAVFDEVGFEFFLAALQLLPAVEVSAFTLRDARRRLDQAARAGDRDLDDAIYLACAVDGAAQLLTSEDSDLLSLGDAYEAVQVVNWPDFAAQLRKRHLW